MKKPVPQRNLALVRHTIRPLSDAQLVEVQGGTNTIVIVSVSVSMIYTFTKVLLP
jgi:hypothetical protein